MKRIICSSALFLGLGFFLSLQGLENLNLEESNSPITKPAHSNRSRTPYAFYFSNQIQLGILPNDIIKFDCLGSKNYKKFDLSDCGGAIIPISGRYLITYRLLVNTSISVALYANENLIPETGFSNMSASPIYASTIVYLNANDKLTIRSLETSKIFNTITSVSSSSPTMPVSMTVLFLDN